MNIKKFGIIALVIVVMALVAGVASAQDEGRNRLGDNTVRQLIDLAVEATGLEPQELLAQLRDDSTLADVITANGGDVDTFIASAVSAVTERINEAVASGNITQERADNILGNLEETVSSAVNGEWQPGRGGRGSDRRGGDRVRQAAGHELIDAVAEATGLEPQAILQQMRENEGMTLAQVVEANGGSVDAVIAAAIASATERINEAVANENMTQEQADELLATLEEKFTEAVNNPLPDRPERPGGNGQQDLVQGVLRAVAEATGLEGEAIREQIQSGATLSDILTAQGVDVETFVDEYLSNMQQGLRERLIDFLNQSRPAPDNDA